jgi:hypothetical protein
MKKSLLPFLAMGMNTEITPTTSTSSMEWYNKLTQEQQTYLKEEGFELLTGQSYESMGLLFSHEERVKIAYDKMKLEGFDV